MKMKCRFIFLAALMACCGVFSATNNPSVKVDAETTNSETLSSYEKINNFDVIQDVFECEYYNKYGIVDLNTDSEYITQGKGSLKMEVHGSFYPGTSLPYMRIPFDANGGMKDVSRLKNVQFDVYSTLEEECSMQISLAFGNGKNSNGKQLYANTSYENVTLKPGWNHIRVDYDAKGLGASFNLKEGGWIMMRFPRAADEATKEENVFYLDNLGIGMTLKQAAPYTMDFDEGEVFSCDKAYQAYMVETLGISSSDSYPLVSINSDKAYTVNHEGKSLKVVAPTQETPGGSVYFRFNEQIPLSFDWVQLGAENKYFVFDVYNDTGSDFTFTLKLWRSVGDLSNNRMNYNFKAIAGEWTTIRFSIQEWVTPQADGYVMMGQTDGALNSQGIEIGWSKFSSAEKTFYFDNFRIEDAINS